MSPHAVFFASSLLVSHSFGQEVQAAPPSQKAAPAKAEAAKAPAEATEATETKSPATEVKKSEGDGTESGELRPSEEESPTEAAVTSDQAAAAPSVEEPPKKEAEVVPAPPAAPAPVPQKQTETSDDDYSQVSTDDLVPAESTKSKLVFGIGIDLSLPIAQTAQFVSNVSLQGFSLDLRYFAWGNWGIGAQIAFSSLSEKTEEPLEWGGYVFNAVQVREQSFMPIALKGVYAWRDREKFVPYVAAGLGASRTVQRVQVGWSELRQSSWHFLMIPEVGGYLSVGPTVLFANARLNYLPPSGGQSAQLYGNLTLGVTVQ
jgi:opacity protein-like surface antigen